MSGPFDEGQRWGQCGPGGVAATSSRTSTARSQMESGTGLTPASSALSISLEIPNLLASGLSPNFCIARSKTSWRTVDIGASFGATPPYALLNDDSCHGIRPAYARVAHPCAGLASSGRQQRAVVRRALD